MILFLALGLGAYFFISFPYRPYGNGGILEVKKGMSVRGLVEALEKMQLTDSPKKMRLYLRYREMGAFLKVGEYQIPPQISPHDLVEILIRGERLRRTFTIPEGYSVRQIAQVLAEKGIARPEVFVQTALGNRAASEYGLEGTTLEGYLFPDTYEYTQSITEQEIIEMMVHNFKKHFDEKMTYRSRELGMSPYQILTLASIIEKETARPEERPLISGVFHNRLKQGIPLATDPTIIYGIPNYDGNIHKSDLQRDGPYNTYLRQGLPPTPIASPGEKSLQAALYPAINDAIFLESQNDGPHQFSKTLEEHNAAVVQYQLSRSPSVQPESHSAQ